MTLVLMRGLGRGYFKKFSMVTHSPEVPAFTILYIILTEKLYLELYTTNFKKINVTPFIYFITGSYYE